MIVNKELIEELLWDDYNERFEVVERGTWLADHKFQTKTIVLLDKGSGKWYEYVFSRSGSEFTEYFYDIDNVDEVELTEVVPVEVVYTVWRRVGE